MNLSEFDYQLPQDLIAQYPVEQRDKSRMMVVDRTRETVTLSTFNSLPEFLRKDDLLILNDTKVIPARLLGKKAETGGRVELLLLEEVRGRVWRCMFKRGKRIGKGAKIAFAGGYLRGVLLDQVLGGIGAVEFDCSGDFLKALEKTGKVPLPPYIKRAAGDKFDDPGRYQTVFARNPGSSAAPTAGLHFTEGVLSDLGRAGVKTARVTLHVGPGTFVPIRTDRIEDHKMEPELYRIPEETVEAVKRAARDRSRVLAVGSTSLRCVESFFTPGPMRGRLAGHTDLFIYPGYEFRRVNGMVTNFHLPKTTLFALVCALAGRGLIKKAYAEAIANRYRFYSYGDAMLIL